jgi:hypothetical protein
MRPLVPVALALLLAVPAPGWAGPGPDDPRATATAEPIARGEIARFLREAAPVASRPIGKGVTGSLRVTLSDGTHTADAAFQSVDRRGVLHASTSAPRSAEQLRFVDSYKYNLAAYAVAGLVGLEHMMPVTVERRIEGRPGALTWWMPDILMDETEREAKGIDPPHARDLHRQRQTMMIFAELVGDTDRNRGNILYTHDWQVRMIDFTRAFRRHAALRAPQTLQACDRALLQRLEALTRDGVEQAAGRWLATPEIDAVMARRDRLVAHVRQLVAVRGEAVALY